MAIDTATPRSRRALLNGALGGAVAAVAATVLGAQRVFAAGDDGKILHVGDQWLGAQTATFLGMSVTNTGAVFAADHSGGGIGLYGASNTNHGVHASSGSGDGVFGNSVGANGIHGFSLAGGASGVFGRNDNGGFGVAGRSDLGIGVQGNSQGGRGGMFKGGAAQVRLQPAGGNHPHSGEPGDLFVDSAHRLWFCKGGTTWSQLA